MEAKLAGLSSREVKRRTGKIPLEEVKNVLTPIVQMTAERGHVTSRSTKAKSGDCIAEQTFDPCPTRLKRGEPPAPIPLTGGARMTGASYIWYEEFAPQ